MDTAQPVRPKEHAQPQEDDQEGDTDSGGTQRNHHAHGQDATDSQEQQAHIHQTIIAAHSPSPSSPAVPFPMLFTVSSRPER